MYNWESLFYLPRLDKGATHRNYAFCQRDNTSLAKLTFAIAEKRQLSRQPERFMVIEKAW